MMSSRFPVPRRKHSDKVRESLLAIIEEGRLGPGNPLPSERGLMESLGAGRPAVREAMEAPERFGVIAIRHGERPRVVGSSLGCMIDDIGSAACTDLGWIARAPRSGAMALAPFEVAAIAEGAGLG